MREVLIVPTGTANIASVTAAFARLGAASRLAQQPAEIRDAGRVMLPGVGSFGAAIQNLRARGFDAALRERIADDRPTLAICVGHQLLFETSSESSEANGLGVVAGEVTRFPDEVRVPQFGWNEVQAPEQANLVESGWAYFANSYRALAAEGWLVATAEHGGTFVAAMERSNIVTTQFHPELSGDYGAALLARFLELG